MYESSDSHFFRTTTKAQSGPDTFDESRFIMTLLTTLVVIKVLCILRLVPEGKTGKEIPEPLRSELLEKSLANNSALTEGEDNPSRLLNRRGTASPLLRTPLAICQKSQEWSSWEVMHYSASLSTCSICTHISRIWIGDLQIQQ